MAQAIQTRLLLSAGEWFLDSSEGTQYQTQILGHGTQATRDPAIRERIFETPGVKEILSYASAVNAERLMSVNCYADTIYGRVQIQGSF